VADYLDRVKVGLVVLQDSETRSDVVLLREALLGAPATWREEVVSGTPAGVRVFGRIGPVPHGPLHIQLRTGMGRRIELHR
jgi:hypothetical protein